MKKQSNNDDYRKAQLTQLVGGYGFASFCYIIAFIILSAAAIYVSPVFCGSNNEAKMLKGPHEIDTGYAQYQDQATTKNQQV